MNDWSDLTLELDAWRDAGRGASFWWRDDDAVEPTPALERLLALAERHAVPLMLAVVPAKANEALAIRLARAGPGVVPVQHGFAHLSYAPPGERSWELGGHRPLAEVLADLRRGWARMDVLFGEDWLPVMVPPWNRIDAQVVAALGTLGYCGLSAAGPRKGLYAAPGVIQVNAHADIMRWTPPRGFLGAEGALKRLLAHLRDRRLGRADPEEPSGLLTHHLAHDAGCWGFLERLMTTLGTHPAAEFVAPRAVFAVQKEVGGQAAADDRRGAA